MMYRCGWALKENQERVLAFWIKKADFEAILSQAVFSSFKSQYYSSQEEWRSELEKKPVRLQWDPEHDPFGNKLERRAIQLGLKGKVLEDFGCKYIHLVEDVTPFVKEKYAYLQDNPAEELIVPVETLYSPEDEVLGKRLGIQY